jgi:Flp pilus assembly protein TadB
VGREFAQAQTGSLDWETVHKLAERGLLVFDLTARQKLNRGYSDGLSRALEIVVTPLLLGFLGHLIDSWLGTSPGFTLAFGIFGVVGIATKLWLGYDREMRKHEARLPGARSAESS